jgi:hypothetical protein
MSKQNCLPHGWEAKEERERKGLGFPYFFREHVVQEFEDPQLGLTF